MGRKRGGVADDQKPGVILLNKPSPKPTRAEEGRRSRSKEAAAVLLHPQQGGRGLSLNDGGDRTKWLGGVNETLRPAGRRAKLRHQTEYMSYICACEREARPKVKA